MVEGVGGGCSRRRRREGVLVERWSRRFGGGGVLATQWGGSGRHVEGVGAGEHFGWWVGWREGVRVCGEEGGEVDGGLKRWGIGAGWRFICPL